MITTILNIKGGCSKTLTAEMLARGYAKEGRKTLVVDADGQGDIKMCIRDRRYTLSSSSISAIREFVGS